MVEAELDLGAKTRPASIDFFRPDFRPSEDVDLGMIAGTSPALNNRHRETRNALVVSLVLTTWRNPERWTGYSRDNNTYAHLSFYHGKVASYRALVWAVGTLQEAGLIEERRTRPGPAARFRSTIRASPALVERVPITHIEQLRRFVDEPIRLKDGRGRLLRYARTFETELLRTDAMQQNEALQSLKVELRSPRWSVDERGLFHKNDHVLNPANNQYYRVFNQGWNYGGRWYSHWIQSLPKSDRLHLRFDGYEVIEHDFAHLHPTLLAAMAGQSIGPEDPYKLPGWPRPEVKLAFNILVNALNELSALRALQQALKEKYPMKSWDRARQLVKAVKDHHPQFDFAWGSGFGRHLQAIDSRICADVQRIMRRQGSVVLSVHDSFIAEIAQTAALESVMQDVLERTLRVIPYENINQWSKPMI